MICGNFATWGEHSTTTTNLDAPLLQLMLSLACSKEITWSSVDITSAFLNADIHEDDTILITPLPILVKMDTVKPNTAWRVKKAIYGLREAPRLWQQERDQQLRDLEFVYNDRSAHLVQSYIHPSLWFIAEGPRDSTMGILSTADQQVCGQHQGQSFRKVRFLCWISTLFRISKRFSLRESSVRAIDEHSRHFRVEGANTHIKRFNRFRHFKSRSFVHSATTTGCQFPGRIIVIDTETVVHAIHCLLLSARQEAHQQIKACSKTCYQCRSGENYSREESG